MSKFRKETLFAQGCNALRKCGIEEECYACPICGTAFGKSSIYTGELTEEHVPPKSIGGKAVLLTCKECNSFAGHSFEFAAKDRTQLERKVKGLFGRIDGDLGHVQIEIGKARINADFSNFNDVRSLKLSEKHNSPSALALFTRERENMTLSDSIQIHVPDAYKQSNVRLTDLKAGFLAATAKFGYSYGLSKNLNFIREQLRQAHEKDNQLKYLNTSFQPINSIAVSFKKGICLVRFQDTSFVLPMPFVEKDVFLSNFGSDQIVDEKFQVFELPKSFEASADHNGSFIAKISHPSGA